MTDTLYQRLASNEDMPILIEAHLVTGRQVALSVYRAIMDWHGHILILQTRRLERGFVANRWYLYSTLEEFNFDNIISMNEIEGVDVALLQKIIPYQEKAAEEPDRS